MVDKLPNNFLLPQYFFIPQLHLPLLLNLTTTRLSLTYHTMAAPNNQVRRRLFTPSESIAYPTVPMLEQDVETNLRLLDILDALTTQDAPTTQEAPTTVPIDSEPNMQRVNQELHRMLSLQNQVSTTSSAAERHAEARATESSTFRKIGAGACGAIFAQDGKPLVYKLDKSGDDESMLWNDFLMHLRICKCFDRFIIDEVKVPQCLGFVPKSKTTYFDKHPGLGEAAIPVCNFPTHALVAERIHPLPKSVRDCLIEKFCLPKNQNNARADVANRDCLVRVYLGSTKGKIGAMFFSLRNFKLHLNHMLEVKLDVEAMSRRMGIALAVMHWAAKTDARDVEFVLGSSTKKTQIVPHDEPETLAPFSYFGPSSEISEDFYCRTTELFLLDFNQVRTITLDDEGVAMAVDAWRVNDPYYPKPLRESSAERSIWKEFVNSYIVSSQSILESEAEVAMGEVMKLPRKFILGIIDAEKQKMASRMEN